MARDFPPPEKPGIFKGWINNLVVEVRDPARHEEAMQQVYDVLGKAHHFDPHDKDGLMIWDTMQGAKITERIFSVMTLFFGAVATLTLALGGIGVMNIMLVAVTERTREIGVRKALGATRADIRRQFFAEAASLTLFSGALGFVAGISLCFVMSQLPLPEIIPHPVVSLAAIVASIATLGAISVRGYLSGVAGCDARSHRMLEV